MLKPKVFIVLSIILALIFASSLPLSDLVTSEFSNLPSFARAASLVLAALSIFLLFFGLLRLQGNFPITFTSTEIDWRFGLPLFLSGIVFWAGFFPALMSPDSVSQWENIVTAKWDNAHANVVSWILYPISKLWLSPAIVPALQIPLLSFAVAVLLSEQQRWLVPRYILWVAAFTIALIPFNPLLLVHFWKDIPYAAAMLLATALVQELVRTEGSAFTNQRWTFCFVLSLAALMLVRHNGLAIPAALLPTLLVFYWPARKAIVKCAAAVFGIFIGMQGLYSICDVQPLGEHYKAAHPIHIMGAYLQDDYRKERLAPRLPAILPIQEWQNSYNCQNLVPLFWNKQINYAEAVKKTPELWRLVASEVANDPAPLLNHQLCLTSILWRILPMTGDRMLRVVFGIADMAEARALGLSEQPASLELKKVLTNTVSLSILEPLWRPAIYLFVSIFVSFSLYISARDPRIFIFFIPIWANTLGLAVFMLSPDFRYQWPLILTTLCLWPLIFRRVQLS